MRSFRLYSYFVRFSVAIAYLSSICFAAPPDNQPIAQYPPFQAWVSAQQRLGNPDLNATRRVAEQLTWGEAKAIHEYGGVSYIEINSGCPHKCMGCMLRCDIRPGMKRMTWEEFKRITQGISGLQGALNEIAPNQFKLLHDSFINLYMDSDPMNIRVKTEVKGQMIGPREIMKESYRQLRTPTDIVTAGWTPSDRLLEDSARKLALDMETGNAPYVRGLQLEVKTMTKGFAQDVASIMTAILKQDPEFMQNFGTDFLRHGLNFNKYANRNGATVAYGRLAHKHYGTIIAKSKYMQDRISNLKVFLKAINGPESKAMAVFYDVYAFKSGTVPDYLRPFQEGKKLADFINEHYLNGALSLNGELNFNKVQIHPWRSLSEGKRLQRAQSANTVLIMENGNIAIDSNNNKRYFMTLSENPNVRSLAHRPIFRDDPRPAWQRAADRMDTTQEPFLSTLELKSVEDHIKQTVPDAAKQPLKLGKRVRYLNLNGRQNVPTLEIHKNGAKSYFNLLDGTIIPRAEALRCHIAFRSLLRTAGQ